MKRLRRLVLRAIFWQALLAAPLALVRTGLTAAGLDHIAEDSNDIRIASLGGGVTHRSTATTLTGGAIAWFWGGVILDLRHATMAPGGAVLRVATVMGGCVIRVPANWNIELRARSIMGGAEAPKGDVETEPTLRINALTIMGGLNVVRARPGDDAAGDDDGLESDIAAMRREHAAEDSA